MKETEKMKNLSIIVTILSVISSFGSIAQTSYSNIKQAKQEIIGTWLLENDPNTKFIYESNSTVKTYYSDVLYSTHQYEISHNCNGEKLDDQLFLKTLDNPDQAIECTYLENINYNNNGRMTLVTQKQGKVIVLIREL